MKPGDKVICVNADGTAINMAIQEIVEGQHYTIAWRGQFTDPFYEGTYDGIRLAEVRRGVDPVSGKEDKPFKASRFRPVVTAPMVKRKVREAV
jgi:hypothetical protein